MPPNHFESEVESFLEGSHGDRTHIKRADHHTVTPLCGTLLRPVREVFRPAWLGVCVSAKKFAQRAENTPKVVFLGLLGEFCRGLNRGEGLRWANFVAHTGTVTRHHR